MKSISSIPRLFAKSFISSSVWMLFALMVLCCHPAKSAEKELPLIERDPFDLVVLKDGGKKTELEVLLLDIPGRRATKPFPSGTFLARTLENPADELKINWGAVDEIRFYEQQLMKEALVQSDKGNYNLAFRYFVRLDNDYPDYPGLDEALVKYLRDDALAQFRKGNHAHALAVLQSLYQRAKNTPGVAQAVDAVSNSILETQWKDSRYDSIRNTMEMLQSEFPGLKLQTVNRWQGRLDQRHNKLLSEAQAAFGNKRYRVARKLASGAFDLKPNSLEAQELIEELRQANPVLRIAVSQPYYSSKPAELDTPVRRRTGRLLKTSMAFLDDFGASGGVYKSPFGEIVTDEDKDKVTLRVDAQLNTDGQLPYKIVRGMLDQLEQGTPDYAALANRLTKLEVQNGNEVVFHIEPPHPHPASLLRGPVPALLQDEISASWSYTATDDNASIFQYNDGRTVGGYQQIEEIQLTEEQGLRSLISGDIQVLANLSPWNLARLKSNKQIEIGQYRIPTLHCLILSGESWLVTERESRRGLCYALGRAIFIQEILLAGQDRNGFDPLSGPFPTGLSLSDPLRYAYYDKIEPRTYQPRLAALLMALAAQGGADKAYEREELVDPAKLPPIRLAHSPSDIARISCRSIQSQLKGLGVNIELVELNENELTNSKGNYDLRYAEINVGEPMVDVWPLLGPGGLSGECSESLLVVMNQLNEAYSSVDLAEKLRLVHEIAHGELPFIPLWQTVDHYAFRKDLAGLPFETVDLYQTVEQWRLNQGRRRPRR